MAEKTFTARRSSPRRPTEKKMTERQRAARTRQLQEARSMTKEERRAKAGAHGDLSQRQVRTSGPRITQLIIDELGKALATVLKMDGPADVLMSRFFRLNHKLGSRDRSLIAEAIFYTLRHLSTITWQMKPIQPVRAPRLTAMVALARQYGRDAIDDRLIGNDAGPLDNIMRSKPENANTFVANCRTGFTIA